MPRALWVFGLVLAACPAPQDPTPQIAVRPWGPRGMRFLEGPNPARVHTMQAGEELGGPNAIGQPGDLVIENDEVVFVIDRLGASAGFAESGGNVVDAADARLRKDELGQQFTYFGVFPRQGVYSELRSGTTEDGSVWVEARGRELIEPKLRVTTRYVLPPRHRALILVTEVENTSDAPIDLPGLGDAIQWGGAEKLAPGKELGFKGDSRGRYVGGVGRFASYALAVPAGDVDATSGSTWTDTLQAHASTLPPGSTTRYTRLLVVGGRPDTSSLVADLARAAWTSAPDGGVVSGAGGVVSDGGGAPHAVDLAGVASFGAVRVRLTANEGTVLPVPPDARLTARDASGTAVLGIHASGDPPELVAMLPAGKWMLAYAGGGGRAGTSTTLADVTPGGQAQVAITASEPAAAGVSCVDAAGAFMPCKVTFEALDGTPPDFGSANVAGPARNQVTTADGHVDVPLAIGGYRVTASRGPEYALAQAEVTLAPGDHPTLRLSPRRVLDTAGYLGCDFHQHTMLGTDSPVSTRDRVVSNAAEGVEVAVATEHNLVVDFQPIVKELHLESAMVSIAGDEVTSDACLRPWGHANAWPMPFDAATARGGAPPVRGRTPRELFDQLRKNACPDCVLQINHPRSGRNGYFDLTGFDRATGVGTAPGYDPRFDALEVWNGRNVDARDQVLVDFFALLRTQHPVTPTADTDTHGIVGQEAGYPRTFVRVADDEHIEAWNAARTEDVARGVRILRDVVLTNGPMLRVTANGAPIGAVARGPLVTVKVHVESAPWVVVDEVHLVRVAGGPAPSTKIVEQPLASGAIGADVAFTLRASSDDAFVVVATGAGPLSPVVPGPAAETRPWSMTGAIWIDADGDGHALGR